MSLRLYFRIGELSDPIFGDAEELQAGDHVRLYTRGGNDCVGEGRIMDYPGETWGTTGIFLAPRRSTRGLTRRWVVRLETPNIRRASLLYPDENDPRQAPATAQIGERVGKLLLWEAGRLRKVPMDATANDTRASRAKDGGPNHMAGLSSVTEASIEEASGACASLGQQGMPPHSPAAAEAEFTSPSETFFDGNLLGVEALSAESMAVAAAGDGAERVGGGVGVADGDGEQEPVVLGASAAVSSEEDREENPIQVR